MSYLGRCAKCVPESGHSDGKRPAILPCPSAFPAIVRENSRNKPFFRASSHPTHEKRRRETNPPGVLEELPLIIGSAATIRVFGFGPRIRLSERATQAASIETICPNGARRFSVEAQITGYGGASLGKVPQRSVRSTSVWGTIPRSRSQSKHGRKSVPPPPTGISEIGSPA